jgi:hypothetical protein
MRYFFYLPIISILCFSLKHPAKYIGRKPRKYTVPVPVKADVSNGGNNAGGGGSLPGPATSSQGGPGGGPGLRASGRRGLGVEPLAAQAAAAAQVRTYRDNGVKHSTSSYNRVRAFPLPVADLIVLN